MTKVNASTDDDTTKGPVLNLPLVLIADSDPTTRLVMRKALEMESIEVIEATNGKEAVELYESQAPDAVLLETDLPEIDGMAVCKYIRDGEILRNTPICIISDLEDFDSADRAYHIGATDIICKPIAWSVFAYRVRYLLRASEALNEIHGLLSVLPDIIYVLDENGLPYDRETGLDRKSLHGMDIEPGESFSNLFSDEDQLEVRAMVQKTLQSGKPQIFEHQFDPCSLHLETRFVARGRKSVLAIVRDITKRKNTETQIYELAYYDRLTGLPNRQLFTQEIDALLEQGHRHQMPFAVMFLDLDRFKRINDTMGHSIGDELLKAVAKRLDFCKRPGDYIGILDQKEQEKLQLARLGGDEFVILIHDVSSKEVISRIAERILNALSTPLDCGDHQLVVTPSIGIAVFPEDGETKDELLMNADTAMYRAKGAGRNNFKFYSDSMKVRMLHRLSIEGDLRRAIEDQDFELYYQPKVDLATWSIVGAEALLRWKHKERGWISPVDFIPIAEDTGLILPLGEWVMQTASQQLSQWCNTPFGDIVVSVNVSSKQVYSDDLFARVTEVLSKAKHSPGKLELEITESLLMQDVEETIATLVAIKELGLGLSVDDFGTGFSSLSYLKRLPIDALKIDRSFVCDLQHDNDDAAICAAILAMAKQLGLKVIAEGVEQAEQMDYLSAHGCDQMQGYLVSRPLPVLDFERLYLAHAGVKKSAAC